MNETDPYRPPDSAPAEPTPKSSKGGPLKDLRPLAWLAVVAIWIQIATNITTILLVKTPENIGMLVLFQVLTALFAGVCFLVWYFRAAFNMFRVHPHAPIRPVWGVCCYIVPIANFICPYLEMRKLVCWTFVGRPRGFLEAVAAVWWCTFLGRIFVNRFAVTEEAKIAWVAVSVASAVAVTVLIFRIAGRQAAFRWEESPSVVRTEMQPLSRQGGLPPRRRAPIPGSELEDGWGKR